MVLWMLLATVLDYFIKCMVGINSNIINCIGQWYFIFWVEVACLVLNYTSGIYYITEIDIHVWLSGFVSH